jgi:type IV secretion system protein VirB9
MTVGGEAVSARGAAAAASVLPDGSIRYEYGRRPDPLLACKPQYVCDITLDSGETVLNMAIGDTARWVIAAGRSGPGGTTPQIFVKPTQPGLETNLVITTTKRLYDVALHSTNEARHPHISFAYPDDDAAAKAAAADHEKLAIESVLAGTPLVGPDKLDANYKFSGETTLTPDKVFNDGVRTYVQWKTLPPELPEVVVSGASGTGQLLNFRVVGAMYVIDTVLPNFDLVLGSDTDRRGRPERRLSIRHQ